MAPRMVSMGASSLLDAAEHRATARSSEAWIMIGARARVWDRLRSVSSRGQGVTKSMSAHRRSLGAHHGGHVGHDRAEDRCAAA